MVRCGDGAVCFPQASEGEVSSHPFVSIPVAQKHCTALLPQTYFIQLKWLRKALF